MPRGAKPGQGRGGRPPGSKNRKTLLKQASLAAAADPNISPKDFLLAVMRDPGAPIELRLQAARIAAPLVQPKPDTADAAAARRRIPRSPTASTSSPQRLCATTVLGGGSWRRSGGTEPLPLPKTRRRPRSPSGLRPARPRFSARRGTMKRSAKRTGGGSWKSRASANSIVST